MNQAQLASALGVSRAMVTKWKKKGMPINDAGAAKTWLSVHVASTRPREAQSSADLRPARPVPRNLAALDTWEARLKRTRDTELATSRLVQAAIKEGKTAQLGPLLKSHSAAVDAVALAEKLASEVRLASKETIHVEEVRDILRELLTPLREALDALPLGERSNCNPERPEIAEKALTAWRDRLLARGMKLESRFGAAAAPTSLAD